MWKSKVNRKLVVIWEFILHFSIRKFIRKRRRMFNDSLDSVYQSDILKAFFIFAFQDIYMVPDILTKVFHQTQIESQRVRKYSIL